MDNFYTSLQLLKGLKGRSTFACGTVSVNRGEFPNNFKVGKLDCRKSTCICNNKIVAVHWKDKRDVFMMSYCHGKDESLVERHSFNIIKPSMIMNYNNNMDGVNKHDQYHIMKSIQNP